jgi:hypothetical protein
MAGTGFGGPLRPEQLRRQTGPQDTASINGHERCRFACREFL